MYTARMDVAVFGGGCFWCTEAVFKMLKGVNKVEPGYAEKAEVVRIEYDPALITYTDLLTVFFGSHDATQVNRQGADVGKEYRSIVLYTSESQKTDATKFITELNASSNEGNPIATEVKALDTFYNAEPEHLDFYARNRSSMYCQIVIEPKLRKVQEQYAALLADRSKRV